MEKICPGVYRLRFGTPEEMTFTTFREYPAQSVGGDNPPPFIEEDVCFDTSIRGCALTLPQRGEVYGFGLQLRTFRHTLGKRTMRCNADALASNGESHAPVPFFVTTEGYGVLIDSARDVSFYCGQARPKGASRSHANAESSWAPEATDEAYRSELGSGEGRMRVEIPVAKGAEVYLFAGDSMLDAVQKYNMFCGGGCKLPDWGLGVWYRMYGASSAVDWVRFAKRFREDGLPVTVLGLEPGWHTHAYSCSYVFDDKRLGDHEEAFRQLREMGYHINLWEHCYTHPSSPIYEELMPYAGDHEVWGGLVPDFTLPEAREIYLRQHAALGADCFKLDECDGADLTGGWSYPDGAAFPSGLDGEQMHHLLGLLYQQTINQGYPDSCHSVRASGAMASPYPFILYSDLYDHKDFIRGVVNAGFSGLLWAPEIRHAKNLKDFVRRLQTALFSPQMLINAWYLKNPPWDQLIREKNNADEHMPEAAEALRMVKALFDKRAELVSYLERMYQQYHDTGKPVFRALILDYPQDEACQLIDDEYLMGDDYLFAPLTEESDTRQVYLPEGTWQRDGQTYLGGWHEFTCALDEYLLFERVK
ncbi:MAG: glycoside hydrolase [Clostridia bacterium]|nr:glycoside hydrolase [Clostridia bacterium]